MSVADALLAVAERAAANEMSLALAGHEVSFVSDNSSSSSSGRTLTSTDEAGMSARGRLVVSPTRESTYPRYFVPDPPEEIEVSENKHDHQQHDAAGESSGDGGSNGGTGEVPVVQGSTTLVPVVGATNLGTWCNDRAFEAGAALGDEHDCKFVIGHLLPVLAIFVQCVSLFIYFVVFDYFDSRGIRTSHILIFHFSLIFLSYCFCLI